MHTPNRRWLPSIVSLSKLKISLRDLMKFQRSSPSCFGFSLLEFAMGLPALLFTVLATLDVSAVLQARSALQQATTTSLRCVYPVDGACTSTIGDTRERYYNFFELPDAGDDNYVYRRVDLSGTASFFRAPKQEMGDFNTRLLRDVHFDLPRATYHVEATLNGHRVTQQIRGVVPVATTPFLEGASLRDPSFRLEENEGTFREAASGGPQRPSNLKPYEGYVHVSSGDSTVSLGSNQVTPSDWTNAYSIKVLRAPFQGNCTGEKCSALTGVKTPVSFHLKGSGTSSISGGCGKVGLRLQKADGTDSKDLHGQAFQLLSLNEGSVSGSLNFYPRGVPSGRAAEPLNQAGELGSIGVDYGVRYDIQIRMNRNSGEACDAAAAISWSASDLTVFLPIYSEEVSTVTCNEPTFQSPLGEGYVCSFPGSAGEHPPELVGAPTIDMSNPVSLIISEDITNAYSELEALDRALRIHLDGTVLAPELVSSLPGSVTFLRPEEIASFSNSCPANSGVPELSVFTAGAVPENAVRESASAFSQCAPQPGALSALSRAAQFGLEPQNIRWSETGPVAVQHAAVTWTKWTCAAHSPGYEGLPSELKVYPREKLTWTAGPSNAVPNFEIVPTGQETSGNPAEDPNDPASLKATNPLYQCDDLSIGTFVYDDSNRAIDRSSLFVGIRDNIDACSAGEVLRTAAESSLIPEAMRLQSSMFFRPGPAIEKERIETTTPPQDLCLAFRVREGEVPGRGTKVAGGPFKEGAIPAACQGDDARCRRIFAHFGPGEAGETKVLTQKAEELGRQELFAAVPWSARSCGEETCGNVKVEENSPAPGMLTSTASTKVKLTTLLGKEITLSHSHRERLEVQLAR